MKKKFTHSGLTQAVSTAILCMAPTVFLHAESTAARSNYLIVGAASLPEFEGAEDQSTKPLIAASMRWENRYVAWDGTSGRFNVLNHRAFEFGPAVNVTFGRDDDIEPLRVRKLGEIDDAFEAGAFAAYSVADVFQTGDVMRFSLQALTDVSDTHEGTLGELATSYRMRINERLALTAAASLSFANDDYADTYFSVSPAGAVASTLPAAKIDGGAKDAGLSISLNYDLSNRWTLFGFAKTARLLGDFADSPIVELEGDKNQVSAGMGIGWRF